MKFLKDLYNQFLDKWFYRMYTHDNYRFNEIDVTLHQHEIEQINAQDGTIPLRPYNNETKLILGCGSLKPYEEIKRKNHNPEDLIWWTQYCHNHAHPDCATIDPDIHRNPTVIGSFGYNTFTHFPDESFESINFEGFCLEADEEDATAAIPELIRLLKPNGIVVCSSDNGKIWEQKLIKQDQTLVGFNNPNLVLTTNNKPTDLIKHLWPDMWQDYQEYLGSKNK